MAVCLKWQITKNTLRQNCKKIKPKVRKNFPYVESPKCTVAHKRTFGSGNTIFYLPLSPVHSMSKLTETKWNICFAVPFFFFMSFILIKRFQSFCNVSISGQKGQDFFSPLLAKNRKIASELLSVQNWQSLVLGLLMELIGVEPRFSGSFHKQRGLN